MVDSFISNHTTDDLKIAGEFLTNWLPFLTRDLCDSCCQTLTGRIKSLHPDATKKSPIMIEHKESDNFNEDLESSIIDSLKKSPSSTEHKEHDSFDEDLKTPAIESPCPGQHVESTGRGTDLRSPTPEPSSYSKTEPTRWGTDPETNHSHNSPKVRMSWADMAQEEDALASDESPGLNEENKDADSKKEKVELPREQRERFSFGGLCSDVSFVDSLKKSPSSTEHKEHDSFNEDLKTPAIESPCPGQHVESTGRGTDLRSPTPEPSSYSKTEPTGWGTDPETNHSHNSPKVRMSWADMAQEEDALASDESPGLIEENKDVASKKKKVELPREQRERFRFRNVGRKKDFVCLERVKGKIVNILDGLELHTGVFSAVEQKKIVDRVYELQEKGRRSELGERTYTEPQKWMRGKGRVTIQFGCCYNYAMDKEGNPPGILYNFVPDPIPSLFKTIIKRLVSWHVLLASCTPDSCIVNIYEPGDCIPPHIDSHDFVRPFTTVSFLSECNILFGSRLTVEGAGEFSGSTAIPLPVGSVLVLNGNAADVAKHCVPAVPTKRISITFRKMDETKRPKGYIQEPDLQNIEQLSDEPATSAERLHQENKNSSSGSTSSHTQAQRRGNTYQSAKYRNEHTPLMRPRQTIIAQSATGKDSTVRRFRDSTRNPRPLYHDIIKQADDYDEDEGSSSHSESNSSGRRVRLDRKRIVITRNIEGDDENSGRGNHRDIRGAYRPQNTGRRYD